MNSSEGSSSSSHATKGGWLKSLFTSKPKAYNNEILFSECQTNDEMETEISSETPEELLTSKSGELNLILYVCMCCGWVGVRESRVCLGLLCVCSCVRSVVYLYIFIC